MHAARDGTRKQSTLRLASSVGAGTRRTAAADSSLPFLREVSIKERPYIDATILDLHLGINPPCKVGPFLCAFEDADLFQDRN